MNGMLAMFTHSSTAFRNIHLQQSPTHHVDWKTSTSDKGGGERIGWQCQERRIRPCCVRPFFFLFPLLLAKTTTIFQEHTNKAVRDHKQYQHSKQAGEEKSASRNEEDAPCPIVSSTSSISSTSAQSHRYVCFKPLMVENGHIPHYCQRHCRHQPFLHHSIWHVVFVQPFCSTMW